MKALNLVEVVSFISSITSLILAIIAILAAKSSEKEVRNNFEKTQKVMSEYQEITKEVLAEIDKKSAIIERTVSDSQKQLMDTMTNIINETVLPKKANIGEQMGAQFLQTILSNPQQAGDIMESLTSITKQAEMLKKQSK